MSDLKDKLMEKIDSKEVKMRSRNFFIFTKAAAEVLLIAFLLIFVYLINLSIYLPKRGLGPIGRGFRFNMLLDVVPWNYLAVSALCLGLAFYILYRFTGAYKKHFILIVAAISLLALLFGTALAFSNFNERIEERPQLRGIYRMDQRVPGIPGGPGPRFRDLK